MKEEVDEKLSNYYEQSNSLGTKDSFRSKIDNLSNANCLTEV